MLSSERFVLIVFMSDQDSYLQTILKILPDGIYFKDKEGRFVLVNEWMVQRFGLEKAEDLLGKTDFDIFMGDHAREAFEDEQEILRSQVPLLDKIEHEIWSEGKESWVSTSKVPWFDQKGGLIGIFGVSRDVTKRVLAEQKLHQAHEELIAKNKQLQEDLILASEIQKALMLKIFPTFSGPSSSSESLLTFNQKFLFSGLVGGDFCDVIKFDESRGVILMGDVMGHGVQAALIVSMIRAIISQLNHSPISAGAVLEKVNRGLLEAFHGLEGVSLISVGAIGIDLETKKIQFANAGHYVPFRMRANGKVESLVSKNEVRSPILGIDENAAYPVVELSYEEGDRILFFTDGLLEIENRNQVAYGAERLRGWFEQHHTLSSAEMIEALEADLLKYSEGIGFQDDVGLLITDINS